MKNPTLQNTTTTNYLHCPSPTTTSNNSNVTSGRECSNYTSSTQSESEDIQSLNWDTWETKDPTTSGIRGFLDAWMMMIMMSKLVAHQALPSLGRHGCLILHQRRSSLGACKAENFHLFAAFSSPLHRQADLDSCGLVHVPVQFIQQPLLQDNVLRSTADSEFVLSPEPPRIFCSIRSRYALERATVVSPPATARQGTVSSNRNYRRRLCGYSYFEIPEAREFRRGLRRAEHFSSIIFESAYKRPRCPKMVSERSMGSAARCTFGPHRRV